MSASKTRRALGGDGQGCCKGQRQRTLKDSKMSARPELELKQIKLACREGCVQGGKGGASVTETETGSSCLLTLKCQLMRHTKMLEYNGHALCALFSSHSLSLSIWRTLWAWHAIVAPQKAKTTCKSGTCSVGIKWHVAASAAAATAAVAARTLIMMKKFHNTHWHTHTHTRTPRCIHNLSAASLAAAAHWRA